jgi:hypothetical protein
MQQHQQHQQKRDTQTRKRSLVHTRILTRAEALVELLEAFSFGTAVLTTSIGSPLEYIASATLTSTLSPGANARSSHCDASVALEVANCWCMALFTAW